MPTARAPLLDLEPSTLQVKVIVNNDDTGWRAVVPRGELGDALARQVHRLCWDARDDAPPAERAPRHTRALCGLPRAKLVRVQGDELLNKHLSDIVPSARIAHARVPEADE